MHHYKEGTTAITTYAARADGRRNHEFEIDGHHIVVMPRYSGDPGADTESAFALAEELARSRLRADTLLSRIAELEAERSRLLERVLPEEPCRLLGPGCVREDNGCLYLLNRPDRGFGEWGVCLDGWDELFRRYDVTVSSPQQDRHGQFWVVTPRSTP